MGTSPNADSFYLKPSFIGDPGDDSSAVIRGVKAGSTRLLPWDRLRPYHQDGSAAKFTYVWHGPPGDAVKLEDLFTAKMVHLNSKKFNPNQTCREAYHCTSDEAAKVVEDILVDHPEIRMQLRYRNYSAHNKSQHLYEKELSTYRKNW